MNVGKKWFQWFWVIEPLGGFGAEVFRLFRCCAPVSWTCCEGGKTMWVKSSKSEMTFLNSAVFFFWSLQNLQVHLPTHLPYSFHGEWVQGAEKTVGWMHPVCEIWNLPNFHNIHFLSNRQRQKSIYSQFLPIPTWIQRICFSTFLLQLSQILTSLLLIC